MNVGEPGGVERAELAVRERELRRRARRPRRAARRHPRRRAAGSSGSRSQTTSLAAVRSASVAVIPDSYCRVVVIGRGVEGLVHHERAGGEAAALEEVLRFAVAGERERVDADASGGDAELDEVGGNRLPHADAARLGLDVQSRRSRRAACRRASVSSSRVPYPTTWSSIVPTTTAASSRSRNAARLSSQRFGARLAVPPRGRRPAARAAPRASRRASSTSAEDPQAPPPARAPSRLSSCSILPRIVRRFRCAASYACTAASSLGAEPREPFDDLRRRQRVVAGDRQLAARRAAAPFDCSAFTASPP